jgi:hypothetical protein
MLDSLDRKLSSGYGDNGGLIAILVEDGSDGASYDRLTATRRQLTSNVMRRYAGRMMVIYGDR